MGLKADESFEAIIGSIWDKDKKNPLQRVDFEAQKSKKLLALFSR
jgi:hypothetical protein